MVDRDETETGGDQVMMARQDSALVSLAIGAAIRRARKAADLTVAELAARTQLSQPHLSQLENGKAAPSIAALYSLARALGIGPEELLPRMDEEQIKVTRRGEGALQRGNDQEGVATLRLLAGSPGRVIEAHEHVALPGEHLGGWLEHPGEDFVYVIEGRLAVDFGSGRSEHLEAGDAIWYLGAQQHRWRRIDDELIRVVLVNGHERPAHP